MLPLKWLVRSSVGRPDDVEEHNLAFELFGYSLNQICGNDRIRAIQVTALVSMDAGSEARPRGASVLAMAAWNQRQAQIKTPDRLSLLNNQKKMKSGTLNLKSRYT